MLPTINLQLAGEMGQGGLSATSTDVTSTLDTGLLPPEARFADLLRPPVMVGLPPEGGQGLPLDGSLLPASDELLDAARQLIVSDGGEPLTSAQVPRLPVADDVPITPIVPIDRLSAGQDATFDAEDGSPLLPLTINPDLRPTTEVGDRAQLPGRTAPAMRTELPVAVTVSASSEPQADRQAQRDLPTPLLAESARRTTESVLPRTDRTFAPVDVLPAVGTSQSQPTGASSLPTFTSTVQTGPTTPLPSSIPMPVLDPAWGEVLNERVVFMSAQKISTAEIRLSPAELGPLRVSVAVDDGAANVNFSAQHAVTREAIESALPRLREMLAEQGLSLGNTSVTDHGADADRQRLPGDEARTSATGGLTRDIDDAEGTTQMQIVRVARGLIDTFV